MVTHLVLQFCVVIAFSSSSSCPVFFNFFTKLFTAFSHHFSSCPFCSPPPAPPGPLVDFFQPSSLFTTGGVNGKMEDILAGQAGSLQRTQHKLTRTDRGDLELQFGPLLWWGPSSDQWVTGWTPVLAGFTQKRWTPWEKVTDKVHNYTHNMMQKNNHIYPHQNSKKKKKACYWMKIWMVTKAARLFCQQYCKRCITNYCVKLSIWWLEQLEMSSWR